MRGIHYFQVSKNGQWRPLKKKRGERRAQIPVMKPMFRHELGRLNANTLGVTTVPTSGGSGAVYKADRAYNILTHWIAEVGLTDVFDRANQILLYEGMVGLFRYEDKLRQNVYVRALPSSELFPIPFDAKSDDELDGIMHVSLVTEQWLEEQDAHYERTTGQKPSKPMADMAGDHNGSLSSDFPSFGGGSGSGGKFRGAVATTVWMKPTLTTPGGQYMFLLDDKMYRYRAGTDPQTGKSLALPDGKLPIELIRYTDQPDDWWGYGFCEDLIGPQMAKNRQMTNIERSIEQNRGFTMFDADAIDPKDVQSDHSQFIPYRSNSVGSNIRSPIFNVPPANAGPEVSNMLSVTQIMADQSVGYRSDVITGGAEGRVEGGPGMTMLNNNAQSPLLPVLNRTFTALQRLYPAVLDMLPNVWPDSKTLRVSGSNSIGKELVVQRDQVPTSDEVIIKPTPLLPQGAQSLTQILFQLKQFPGEDGTPGSLISNKQFKESLRSMDLLPPQLEEEDSAGARIEARINGLIGDGTQPAIRAADPAGQDIESKRMDLEDHRLFVQMLRRIMLHEAWAFYSNPVKQNLLSEFTFHKDRTQEGAGRPGAFDDDVEQFDAENMEGFIDAAAADLATEEGAFPSDFGF